MGFGGGGGNVGAAFQSAATQAQANSGAAIPKPAQPPVPPIAPLAGASDAPNDKQLLGF